jgi:hypothetical protein
MTFTRDEAISRHRDAFQSLSVDDQLALFWFIYTEMGKSITPAAPGASTVSPTIAEGLFNQVKTLSHEEQLQLQRDLISNVSNPLAREYGSMGDTTKLLFWYYLAEGMESGTIVPMPAGYELSGESANLFEQIKGLEFQQQITLFRDIVSPMGADAATGIEI